MALTFSQHICYGTDETFTQNSSVVFFPARKNWNHGDHREKQEKKLCNLCTANGKNLHIVKDFSAQYASCSMLF